MRKLLLTSAALAALTVTASAQVQVDGYVRRDGTYVAPHYRSAPDSNPYNNYSTSPNINPYTGQQGTQNPYANGARLNGTPYGDRLNGSSYGRRLGD